MPVQFVSAAVFNNNISGTTVVLPKPASVVKDTLLIALALHNGFAAALWTPPAGWIELEDRNQNQGSNGPNFTYAFLLAGASEPSSYTFTNAQARTNRLGLILAFSGADLVNPINAEANANDDLTPFTCPSVVTTVADCLILRMLTVQDSGLAQSPSTPSGHTQRANEIISGGGESAAAYTLNVIQALAGPTGTVDIAQTASGFQRGVGITFAIAPALGGGGGIMGGDNPSILAPSRERIERGQKILNPFGTKKRACMCPVGKCRCL